jgi:L-threonylcarbamoyladenylate synthase
MPSRADELITSDIDRAVRALAAGGLVALPTETVYGLAADAEQVDAVRRIFEVKGRPADHPLIVHLAPDAPLDGWVDGWADDGHANALTLARTCWPGPLTMLLPRGPRVLDVVTGGRSTVGLRKPAHAVAVALLERYGRGLAAPSANRFGKVSPTSAEHVLADLGDRLDPDRDVIVDGGSSVVGIESTIVDLTVSPPQVLRDGAITASDIERLLAGPVGAASGPSRASGMLTSHYAPDCEVVLADDADAATMLANERGRRGRRTRILDRTGDLVVAAQCLYDDLRRADADGIDVLVVVRPPAAGLGLAIRDRLLKAAAARPGRADRDPSSPGG